jgi:hypothetical protein
MVQTRWMRQERHNACVICSAEFLTEEELAEHRKEVHLPSPGALGCRLCGQQLGTAEELDEHLRRDHGVAVARPSRAASAASSLPVPTPLKST